MFDPERCEPILHTVYKGSLELALRATAAIIEWRREREILGEPLPPYQPAVERPLIVGDELIIYQD